MADRLFFELDGRRVESRAGSTIAEAAGAAGQAIDALCANRLHRDCARCMVCAVYLADAGAFAPACSENVREGMRVESDSERVADFRRAAVELLLSEHHGDCAAPCRRACPAGFDIPRFLELVDAGRQDAARAMASSCPPPCRECDARCEKACRKRVFSGQSVPIKTLTAEYGKAARSPAPPPHSPGEKKNGGNSGTGEAPPRAGYFHVLRMPPEKRAAYVERMERHSGATGCWRCPCQAGDSCVLRKLAEKYGARQFRFAPLEGADRVLRGPEVVFDPGKCVRCGACVELANALGHSRAPCLSSRGADFSVRPPLGTAPDRCLDEWDKRFVDACPTGALSGI